MPKIINCGGSVADSYGKDIFVSYGDYLARTLDYKYIHNARFQGSNERLYKIVVTQVNKGIIKAGDVVVFQISESVRLDMPGAGHKLKLNTDPNRPGILGRYNGHLWSINNSDFRKDIRFKDDSLSYDKLMAFYDLQEEVYALNPDFYTEQWLAQGIMFQGFLKDRGIKFLPIIHRCIGHIVDLIPNYLTAENLENAFWEAHIWHQEDHGLDPNSGKPGREYVLGDPDNTGYFDEHHYNNAGHKYVANELYLHGKEHELF